MDVLKALKERRSINFFDPGFLVPEDKINELLDVANLSPSSFNLQPWRVVVVKDPERKKALRKCAFDQPKAEEASVVLVIIADPGGVEANMEGVFKSWESLGYMKPEARKTYSGMITSLYGEKDSVTRKLFAVKNASLFAMSVMAAAKGLGLETHPMDGFDEAALKKEFGIPGDMTVPMLIAVGSISPGATLLPRAFRRERKDYVSYEKYGKR